MFGSVALANLKCVRRQMKNNIHSRMMGLVKGLVPAGGPVHINTLHVTCMYCTLTLTLVTLKTLTYSVRQLN